jgi:hypothetical protein
MLHLQVNHLADSWHELSDLGKPQGVTTDVANKIGRDLFGIPVYSCKELPSERDRNFLLTMPPTNDGKEGPAYVLKLCNLTETADVIDMQNRALEHLAKHSIPAPTPKKSVNGNDLEVTVDPNGNSVLVRFAVPSLFLRMFLSFVTGYRNFVSESQFQEAFKNGSDN